MRIPNLNALKMFEAAARHLNFRLAAEELNLTQGAVAQQVRRLEADLGFTLFHRRARGLELTDIGRHYHGPISNAFAIIHDATAKLIPQQSQIKISVTPSFATKWLVPRLGKFEEDHPDIEIQIIATEGLSDFKSDGIDLAIRQGQPKSNEGLSVEILSPLTLSAVCSPDYQKRNAPIEKPHDFADHRLINDGHSLWDQMAPHFGLNKNYKSMKFNQTALAMDAAANGHGIAMVPRLLIEPDISQGRLVEVWQENQPENKGYFLVSPQLAKKKQKPALQDVIDWLLLEVS